MEGEEGSSVSIDCSSRVAEEPAARSSDEMSGLSDHVWFRLSKKRCTHMLDLMYIEAC